MIIIKRSIVLFSAVTLLLSLVLQTGCSNAQTDEPDVDIHTFPATTDGPPATPPQTQQPLDQPAPPTNEYNKRSIVVDERNNVFAIGLPAGYQEKREIEAQKPVDVWFEYLPQEIELEVNGVKVERSDRWEFKIQYMSSITELSYTARNTSSQYLSYNLHIIPSAQGETVSVEVKEWWTP
jgi:hypothetical protein